MALSLGAGGSARSSGTSTSPSRTRRTACGCGTGCSRPRADRAARPGAGGAHPRAAAVAVPRLVPGRGQHRGLRRRGPEPASVLLPGRAARRGATPCSRRVLPDVDISTVCSCTAYRGLPGGSTRSRGDSRRPAPTSGCSWPARPAAPGDRRRPARAAAERAADARARCSAGSGWPPSTWTRRPGRCSPNVPHRGADEARRLLDAEVERARQARVSAAPERWMSLPRTPAAPYGAG